MKRSLRAVVVTGVLGGVTTVALIAGGSLPALASDSDATPTPTASATAHPKTLAEIQAAAKVRIDKRLASLSTAIDRATANKFLTDGDQSKVLGTLNADVDGLKQTQTKIAADTDVKTAAADYKSIFTTYRVYAVAIPQSHVSAAADRMTGTTIPKLTAVQKRLSAALTGKFASKSTPELQADLADMSKQIDAASALVDGLSAKALAVTPSDFNSNHDVMKALRADVKTAAADLKKARADGKAVIAALKK